MTLRAVYDDSHLELLVCGACGTPLEILGMYPDGSYREIGCPHGEGHASMVYLDGGTLDLGLVVAGQEANDFVIYAEP